MADSEQFDKRSSASQIAFDQQSDDPAPGDWNDACSHIATLLKETPASARAYPVEPTQEMIEAGKQERMDCFSNPALSVEGALRRIYKAMMDAAPLALPEAKERATSELEALRKFYAAWKEIKEYGGRYTMDMAAAEEEIEAAASFVPTAI